MPAHERPASSDGFAGSRLRRAIVLVVAVKIAGLLLLVDTGGLHAFDLPKSVFGRVTAGVLLALLLLAIRRHGWRIVPRSPLSAAIALYVIAAGAATVTGADRFTSVFGETARYLGLVFVIDMAVLFVAVGVAFVDRDDWLVTAASAAIAGLLVIAYAIIQYAGWDPVPWAGHDRPFSTLGNPDVLGHFLSLGFALGLGLLVVPTSIVPAALRGGGGAFAVACAATALAIGSRGALLGIAAAAAMLPLAWGRARGVGPREWGRVAAGILLLLLAASPLILETPVAVRVRELVTTAASTEGRPLIWESALRASAERPILGWGPDSFAIAYPRQRQPEAATVLGPGRPQESAHNAVLQSLVTTGVVGLVAMLALVGIGSWRLWRFAGARPVPVAPLLLGWAAYWTQALVTVGAVGLDWFPWVTLGAVAAAPLRTTPRPSAIAGPVPSTAGVVLLAAAAAAAVLPLAGSVRELAANRDALASRTAWLAADDERAVRAALSAVASDGARADHWNRLGIALSGARREREAADAYREAAMRRPDETTYLTNLARALARLGDHAQADAAARSAVAGDPQSPLVHHARAEVALAAGACDTALRAAIDAIVLYRGDESYDATAAAAAPCAPRSLSIAELTRGLAAKESAALRQALAAVQR